MASRGVDGERPGGSRTRDVLAVTLAVAAVLAPIVGGVAVPTATARATAGSGSATAGTPGTGDFSFDPGARTGRPEPRATAIEGSSLARQTDTAASNTSVNYTLTVYDSTGAVVGSVTLQDSYNVSEYGNHVSFAALGDTAADRDNAIVDHLRLGDGTVIEDWERRNLTDYTRTATGNGEFRIVSSPTTSGGSALRAFSGCCGDEITSNDPILDIEAGTTIKVDVRHQTDSSDTYAHKTSVQVGADADGTGGIIVRLVNPGSQRTAGAEISTPNAQGRIRFTPDLKEFYTFELTIGDPSKAGPITDYNWTTRTDGDADATAINRTALDFRVYKCSAANATADLGRLSGTLRWSALTNVTVTDAFWERPFLRVFEDGERVATFNFEKEGEGTIVRQNSGNVSVDGNVSVVVGIEPTRFCDNGDHADTYFRLRNLTFSLGSDGTEDDSTAGDDNLTVRTTGSEGVAPGENATIELRFEAGDSALDSVGASVEFGEPIEPDGWPIIDFDAPTGTWDESNRIFSAEGVGAGETVDASFTVSVPEGTAPGDYEVAIALGYGLNGSQYQLTTVYPTVNVTSGGPLALSVEDVTVTTGGETRANVTVENTAGRSLADVAVEVREPFGNGIGIADRIAPVGAWSFVGDEWSVDELAAGERVTLGLVFDAAPDAALGPRTVGLSGRVAGERVTAETLTVEVLERPPPPELGLAIEPGQAQPGQPAGVVDPGETIPVRFVVENRDANATDVTLVVTATGPQGWTVERYEASLGAWNRQEDRWTVSGLASGGTATPSVVLSVPRLAKDGYFTVSAEVRVDGRTVADASTEIQVPGEDGPNERPTATISVNRTVLGSTAYANAGDTLRFDGSASRDPDGSIAAYRWDLDGDGTTDATGPTVAATFAQAGERTVTLTVDDGNLTASAELVVNVSESGGDTDGPGLSNFPPVAAATVSPSTAAPGETVTLSAGESRDRDDGPASLTYEWNLDGDGTTDASGERVTTSYATVGNRSVTLTVTDPEGATATATETVTVRDPASQPEASISVLLGGEGGLPGGDDGALADPGSGGGTGDGSVTVGDAVTFSGAGSTPSPAGTEIERYEWTFGDGTTAAGERTVRTFDAAGTYEVTLTVTDDAGRTDTVTRTVEVRPPEKVPEVVAIEPRVPGRLLQGLGLQNTYFAGVVSDEPIAEVRFQFPGRGTVTGRRVTGKIPFINGSVYAATVPVDALEDGRLVVAATDDDGDTRRGVRPLEVADTPAYLEPLFRNAELSGNRLLGFTVTGGTSQVPSDLVGPSITISDVRFIGGTYGVGVRATLDANYYPGANRVTIGGNAAPEVVASSPFGDTTLFSGGAGISVSGEFGVQSDRVTFDRVALTFPPRQTTIAQFSPAGVFVDLPEVRIPGRGKVDPGGILIGIGVSVSAGVGGTVEVVSTKRSVTTPILPDGAALGVLVTPAFGVTITVGAGSSVTVYGFKFGVALEAFGGGTVSFPLRVVERGELRPRFTGRIEGGYSAGVRACIALCAETVLISGQPTFRLGGSSQSLGLARPADADAPTAGETRIVPKHGVIPVPAVGRNDGDAVRTTALGLDSATGETARLTRDGLADRPASVARGPAGATAVWAGQAPDEPQATGFELYAAERTNGSWGAETRLTNDSRLDIRPSVAAADGNRLAAWSRLTARGVTAGLGGFETVVATRTDAGWTAPTRVTNDSALALNPVVAGAAYDGGQRWLVAWLSDADANLSTGDAAIRYAVLDGDLRTVANGTIPGGVSADVAAGPDGFTLGVLTAGRTRADTAVLRARLGPNGTVRDRAAFDAANVSAVAAAPGRVAWAGGSGADLRLRVARGSTVDRVPTGNFTSVSSLSATTERGATTLTYAATTAGSSEARPVYQVRTVEGWTRPRALPLAGNLSVRSLSVADDGRQLLAVASAAAGPDTRTDVFAVSHRYRPDLRTNATATVSNASTGDATTVEFAVTNRGERASGPAVVAVRNATGTVATRTVGPLAVGERATGSLTLPVDYTGQVRVVADTGDTVTESNESNNAATAVAVAPDVAVLSATDRRVGDRLAIDVRLRNDATVPVGDVPIRVVVGNRTIDATLRGLGAGRNWTLTVETSATGLGPAAPLDVIVDPADRVPESDESNNRLVGRVLRSDLGVYSGATVLTDPQGARAEFVLRNTDTGGTTANVTVETPSGERTYRVTVPPARGPRDVVTVPVSLAVPAVAAGGNLTVAVEPAVGLDATLDDNVVRTRVDTVGPADNASARPLAIANASGRLTNGSVVLTLALRNPGNLTTGEVVTVSRDGAVRAREPVAAAPGTTTVRLRPNVRGAGTYTVATANDTLSVEVSSPLPGPPGDPDGDGLFEDVNGDGGANVVDVAVLLDRFDRPAYQDAAPKFDFNDDGRLNIVDVAELLGEV